MGKHPLAGAKWMTGNLFVLSMLFSTWALTSLTRLMFMAQGIHKACDESLRRLKTDYIDLYQFHDNGFPAEKSLPVRETLEGLVKEGKIRDF